MSSISLCFVLIHPWLAEVIIACYYGPQDYIQSLFSLLLQMEVTWILQQKSRKGPVAWWLGGPESSLLCSGTLEFDLPSSFLRHISLGKLGKFSTVIASHSFFISTFSLPSFYESKHETFALNPWLIWGSVHDLFCFFVGWLVGCCCCFLCVAWIGRLFLFWGVFCTPLILLFICASFLF